MHGGNFVARACSPQFKYTVPSGLRQRSAANAEPGYLYSFQARSQATIYPKIPRYGL